MYQGCLVSLGGTLSNEVLKPRSVLRTEQPLSAHKGLNEAWKEPHPLLIPLSCFTPCHTRTHGFILAHAAQHSHCSNTGKIQLLRIINECPLELLSRNLRKFS